MPSKTKRQRQRQQIDVETIQELQKDFSTRFQKPKQKKGLRLKDVVALMQDQLRDALHKNWSYQDCCDLLAEKNIHISPSTLQQYLRELNQETRAQKVCKAPKRQNQDDEKGQEDDTEDILPRPIAVSDTADSESVDTQI